MLDDPPQSWRVDAGDSDVLEIALFVRDAAGLEVQKPPDVPRLAGVPEPEVVLDGEVHAAAGLHWPGWFRQAR